MIEVDKKAIREKVNNREYQLDLTENWKTPSGNQRSRPMYEGMIKNTYLGKTKHFKKRSVEEIEIEAQQRLTKWNQEEIKKRIKEEAKIVWKKNKQNLEEKLTALKTILDSTINIHDQVKWKELLDHSEYKPFKFTVKKPNEPQPPQKVFLEKVLPFKWKEKLKGYKKEKRSWIKKLKKWEVLRDKSKLAWEDKKIAFEKEQDKKNNAILDKKKRFENGEVQAILEFFELVFKNSIYPRGFNVEHDLNYQSETKILLIDLSLPNIDALPEAQDYKLKKTTSEIIPVPMKEKDREALYDSVLQQTVIRTFHEVFESDYMDTVEQVVINGWVTYTDEATGNDKTSCVISVSAEKEEIEALNLKRLNPSECIKSLKGVIAGPLSNVAPVKPILKLNKDDKRFIESEEILADINSTTNLAEMDWEEFEYLVRELFGEMFSDDSSEVKVTQASRDGGIDAVAFDEDPIRGGKFVIQAKRYTKVVPVSAARDLYGSMISEGASKGILVTTSHFGRDTLSFVKDKPISLINGSELVYLLEEHGHKVRIDIEAARAKLDMERKSNNY